MEFSIHTRVLLRLFSGWIVLSLLIGGIVFYFEMKKVDDRVLKLATQEVSTFTIDILDHFNLIDQTHADILQKIQLKVAEFLQQHFIVIELYDASKQKFLEQTKPEARLIEAELKQYTHSFPLENTVQYNKFYIHSKIYMQVLLPLKNSQGQLAGYFEGLYQVDDVTLRSIRNDVVHILLLVVIVVFATSIVLYPLIISLNRDLMKLSDDLLQGNTELMAVLGSAIAKRDSDTNSHNYRVTIYAIRLAEALKLNPSDIHRLIAGAFLHDVGKIGISDNILLKPDKLTAEEFTIMRTHVLLGVEIIAHSAWLMGAREVVEYHHEKYDGSGYLQGLKGDEIPLNARIFAVVDVFDALTSRRPYKAPMEFNDAMAILHRDRGRHFDPMVVDAFNVIARDLHQTTGLASDQALKVELAWLLQQYRSLSNAIRIDKKGASIVFENNKKESPSVDSFWSL
ncbi:HD-GYP domain-containing protein [Chromatium okenii]|uniref:HD-GYP domain-containing protein n=1 Tax=Chromatium okenii TaxID=61644 RepID=UPI0026EE3935|nr:HD domain-containing phosphohydrolase [Chromatium okenii]MBV5310638.1 HD domain-containing protein [Chromatium okenii]